MPTRIFRFLLLCAGFFLLTSCLSFRDIEVKDFTINNVTMQGTKIVADFSAMVNNPNRTFVIQSAGGDLSQGEQAFAHGQLTQSLTIPGKTDQLCSGQLQITIQDLLTALRMGTDYRSWDVESFLFSGDVHVRATWFKKKFSYKKMPINQLINSLQ
ncbi:MAG: hypothetical protein FWD56_03205 [Bacteroidales bacterium]|nr:hypothetical protein [Bacteroidales bacterium]